MKTCIICNQAKPIEEFYRLSRKRIHHGDGHDTRCKECVKAYAASPKYREKARARDRLRWNTPNRLEHTKRYQQSEKGKAAKARYYKQYRKSEHGHQKILENGRFFRKTIAFKKAILKYREKFPEKRSAHIIFSNALAWGKIHRPDHCSICGKKCIPEGHHPDYTRPLEVIWACKDCHADFHWSYR